MLEVMSEKVLCFFTKKTTSNSYKLFEVVSIELFDEFSLHSSLSQDAISKIEVRDCGTFSSPCLSVLNAAQEVVRSVRLSGTLHKV